MRRRARRRLHATPTPRCAAPSTARRRSRGRASTTRDGRLPRSISPAPPGRTRPITVITKPGTVTHVVMPGASSMRGITGYRVSDVMNGALAQLIPERVPAAGEGGSTLAFFTGRIAGEPFVYSELVVGTWGGRPAPTATTASRTPGEHGQHPGRARRERVADRGRALRARHRLGRRRAATAAGSRSSAPGARSRPTPPSTSAPTARCTGPTGWRGCQRRRLLDACCSARTARVERMPPCSGAAPARRRPSPPHGRRRRLRRPVRAGPRGRRAGTSRDEKVSVAAARELYGVVLAERRRGRSRRDRSSSAGERPGRLVIPDRRCSPRPAASG